MNRKIYMILICFLFFLTACSNAVTNEEKIENKYEEPPKEMNVEMVLEPLVVTSYAEEMGVTIKEPIHKKFEANGEVVIEGEIKKSSELAFGNMWIQVHANDEGPVSKNQDYYTPIKDGKFKETIHFSNGEGEYNVKIQMPSNDRQNYYYETVSFVVNNVNTDIRRDLTYTPFGQEANLSLDTNAGLVEGEGAFKLIGKAGNLAGNEDIMIKLSKDNEKWDTIIPVKQGQFEYDIPLFFGKGLHELEVMVPDKERDNYYQQATVIFIDNKSSLEMKPITYSKIYAERGLTLEEPAFSGDEADSTYRIKGSIDPNVEFASQTTHLYIKTKKGEDEALEVIPVRDFKFDDSFYLRFGPGTYEVSISVPEITEKKSSSFRFYGAVDFEVESKATSDQRDILPSRGVQSDDPQIKELASSLVKGKGTEREKTKAIYDYVAKNITYDVKKFKNSDFNWYDSALNTLELKTGICQDYTYLTIALLRATGIESRYIEGYAGGKHAWVEVNVDGGWLTMDPTWGAGYIENNEFVAKFNEKYFDPKMEEFNKTHSRTGVVY